MPLIITLISKNNTNTITINILLLIIKLILIANNKCINLNENILQTKFYT
ncbi:hypothetical protein HanXRQr2_Chr15g0706531 [Helianthus annuus]|uniref:Uncharacterized protein n=1 Tax=Helianthus annuus TaxID=4232 RepID=A0A9K3E233_HELAN|nr:hypothetical protein HanXRQr2_Chr15g0706531 [Helianthus annuus]KAJ0832379.1 hypothetical protein HanPSC8_Chr15g0678131 [Helianthus annuus]